MTEHYKLTYYNSRGRVEFIRYILALAGVEYEDNRVEKADWPALKPTSRMNQIPTLEVNGQAISQSVAIGRYLARKYKLAGESPMEEFRADEIIDAFGDLVPNMRSNDFTEKHARPFFTNLTSLKETNGGKWIVGRNVTWADIFLAHAMEFVKSVNPALVDEFPVIREIQGNVFALPQIKKWIETRPKTNS